MASIRKRGNKYQVQIRRADSKPIAKSFHKRSDAVEWARNMEVRADRNDLPTSTKTLKHYTVADIVKRYRDEVSIKKKSYNSEVFVLNAFLRTRLAKTPLSQVSSQIFHDYREQRLKNVKAGTVNKELSVIKHSFDMAINQWHIPLRNNPLNKLKKIKVNDARNRRLNEGELEKIKQAANKTRNPYTLKIILMAIESAMRRGELIQLRWNDIDFKKRTLHIPVTKNGHPRTIPLTEDAIQILHSLPRTDERVFPITANALRLSWIRLVKRAEIQGLRFHDLRRESVSRFFEMGLSVPEVALISGHKNFRMLARYTHLRAEDIVEKL